SGGFNRDDRGGDRPSGGFRSGGGDRPYGRRDDHRPSGSSSFGGGDAGRRDDKPRWKRNG
ncbi:hypothetical protein ACIQWR_29575, partial [Streptomyces sp. NPDC098789]|uniref:hypothetical protein n=1 Tax=Streptomyces sp. NPDC098789 TaxID=3366098 RepID=UPI00381B4E41